MKFIIIIQLLCCDYIDKTRKHREKGAINIKTAKQAWNEHNGPIKTAEIQAAQDTLDVLHETLKSKMSEELHNLLNELDEANSDIIYEYSRQAFIDGYTQATKETL
jgi:hypothetical protein